MHLRCLPLLTHNISYADVYVAGVYVVYTCESGKKQGQMLTTCINSITENLTVANLYIYTYIFPAFMEPEVHKNPLLLPTCPDSDESSCKIKQFFSKILFNIILPYEWFIFSGLWNKIMQVSLVRWNITLKEM